jgi:hypothetical protein
MGQQLQPYNVGTIDIAAGGTVVTGHDTHWMGALGNYSGDLITQGRNAGHILSVESDTQLTLAVPWEGPAVVGGRYSAGRYLQSTDVGNLGPRVSDLYERVMYLADEDQTPALKALLAEEVARAKLIDETLTKRLYDEIERATLFDARVTERLAAEDGDTLTNRISEERTRALGVEMTLAGQIADQSRNFTTILQNYTGVYADLQNMKTAVQNGALNMTDANTKFLALLDKVGKHPFVAGRVYPEEYGANADDQNFNNSPAINAMFEEQRKTGRIPTLRPNVTYACADTLQIDPSRNGLEGSSSTFSFHLKTFTDPNLAPELTRNGEFNNPDNWILTGNTTQNPIFDGAVNFTPPTEEQRFLEMGQQVIAPAGSTVRLTMVVAFIESHTVGINTYRDVTWSMRRAGSNPANSIAGGGQVGGQSWVYSNKEFSYKPGAVVTHDFNLSEANPYLRMQTSARIRIESISAKVIPNNVCMLLQVPPAAQGGLLRGHNLRDFRNFGMKGKPGPEAVFVIGTQWDTPIYPQPPGSDLGQHSRAGWYNVNMDTGIGVALDFRNRTYLSNFINIRITAAVACIRTMPGALDSGENIVFLGGNIGAGLCGVDNEGGFEIHMISTSIDFSRQWHKGAGGFRMVAGHLETNQPIDATKPLIDVYGGHVWIDAKLQVNGTTDLDKTILPYPFRVGLGGFLHIETETPYNLQGTENALCEGEGRIVFVARGGSNRAMSTILKRDDVHNLFGNAGGFWSDTIDMLLWCESATFPNVQQDRYTVAHVTEGEFAANFTRSNQITDINADRGGLNTLTIGREIIMDGVLPGTTIKTTNTAGSVMTTEFNKAPGFYGGKWRLAGRSRMGCELSIAQRRIGPRSLRLYREIGGVNQIINVAFPVEANHACGFEMYWMIPPQSPGISAVYFQGAFARLHFQDKSPIPRVSSGQFITDQPQTNIDRSVGVPWTRMTFATNRVDPQGSEHDGYMPYGMTHVVVSINLSQCPGGFEMYIADLCASQF